MVFIVINILLHHQSYPKQKDLKNHYPNLAILHLIHFINPNFLQLLHYRHHRPFILTFHYICLIFGQFWRQMDYHRDYLRYFIIILLLQVIYFWFILGHILRDIYYILNQHPLYKILSIYSVIFVIVLVGFSLIIIFIMVFIVIKATIRQAQPQYQDPFNYPKLPFPHLILLISSYYLEHHRHHRRHHHPFVLAFLNIFLNFDLLLHQVCFSLPFCCYFYKILNKNL